MQGFVRKLTDRFQTLPPKQKTAVPYALLAGAVLLAYANAYRGHFVYDDLAMIVRNDLLRHWNTLPDLLAGTNNEGAEQKGFHHCPLLMLLYFLVYQIFGLWTPAYHALNLSLHVANACLVYRLGKHLGLKPPVSFAAASFWALHPLHTEAVAYISGTTDPLYSFFCLLGLLILLPDFHPEKIWKACLLFLLALASKETAVIFPALATITLFLLSPERLRPTTYIKLWPLWLVSASYIVVRLLFIHKSGLYYYDQSIVYSQIYAHNIVNRTLTCLATLPVYLGLILWPSALYLGHLFPVFTNLWSWQVLAGLLIAAGALLQILRGQAKRGLMLSWGFLWFAICLSPVSGVLLPLETLFDEHWMYLPTVGLTLGTVQSVALWLGGKPKRLQTTAFIGTVVIAASLGVRTYLQNNIWRNSGTLYENTLQYSALDNTTRNNLSMFYWSQGEYEKAIEQLREVIAHPDMKSRTELALIHMNIAMIYLRLKVKESDTGISFQAVRQALPFASRIPETIEELNKALELDPYFFGANVIMGIIYAYQRDNEKAAYYNSRAQAGLTKQTVP